MVVMHPRGYALVVFAFLLGLGVATDAAAACRPAVQACLTAAAQNGQACRSACTGLFDQVRRTGCKVECRSVRVAAREDCRAISDPCFVACGAGDETSCARQVQSCRADAKRAQRTCRSACKGTGDAAVRRRCHRHCAEGRAQAEAACGFTVARAVAGEASLPSLPAGQPADMSLLTDTERAVIAEADARAVGLRSRPLRISALPGTAVSLTQVQHSFPFGFTFDTRKFVNRDDDLDWYASTAARNHVSVAVAENNAKWAKVEPELGVRVYEFADLDVDTAFQRGFTVKGHTLNWGIIPPFSSSGSISSRATAIASRAGTSQTRPSNRWLSGSSNASARAS
jgi:hypothetical protein